jgi:hypothetical protein
MSCSSVAIYGRTVGKPLHRPRDRTALARQNLNPSQLGDNLFRLVVLLSHLILLLGNFAL